MIQNNTIMCIEINELKYKKMQNAKPKLCYYKIYKCRHEHLFIKYKLY